MKFRKIFRWQTSFDRFFFSQEGKLLQFVKDLHSEKLHRDFHNPPPATQPPTTTTASSNDGGESKGKHIPKTSSTGNSESANSANQFLRSNHDPSQPPESVFVRLSPNRARYSFRDEL